MIKLYWTNSKVWSGVDDGSSSLVLYYPLENYKYISAGRFEYKGKYDIYDDTSKKLDLDCYYSREGAFFSCVAKNIVDIAHTKDEVWQPKKLDTPYRCDISTDSETLLPYIIGIDGDRIFLTVCNCNF